MNDRKKSGKYSIQKCGSRATAILIDIGRALDDAYFGLSRPGLVVRFGADGARDYLNRKEIYLRRRELVRLERRGMIQRQKIANQYLVSLSDKGFMEYLVHTSITADDLPAGQMLLLSFDVPEDQRRLRDHIRSLLRRLGFTRLHRSVWSTRKNMGVHLDRLFSTQFHSNDWFKIFLASEI